MGRPGLRHRLADLRRFLGGGNRWDPPSLFKHTRADVMTMVRDRTEQFGSAGKGGR